MSQEQQAQPGETYVVIGHNYWGRGATLDEAKQNFTKQGGRLSKGYRVFIFGVDSEFRGVDEMGYVHWTGGEPEIEEHSPRRTRV